MKKIILLTIAIGVAAPAQAGLLSGARLLDVAKIVLNNRAVLNKGATQCPNQVTLQPQDNLLMTAARNAVAKALPATQFGSLESNANVLANQSSADPNFCQTTATKKPGLLGGIAEAARKLGVGGGLLGGSGAGAGGASGSAGPLGGLGGILGGGNTSNATTGQ